MHVYTFLQKMNWMNKMDKFNSIKFGTVFIVSFSTLLLMAGQVHALTAEELKQKIQDPKYKVLSLPERKPDTVFKTPDSSFDGGKEADTRAFKRYNRARRLNDNQEILDEINRSR